MSRSSNFEHYEAITHGIRVAVTPSYLEERSNPAKHQHVWAYKVEIENNGIQTVQLRSRAWDITDANGDTQKVRGPGVVGEQPILNPGDMFQYSSGCPLTTPSGFMVGHYIMTVDDGKEIVVDIPAFALDLPGVAVVVN